LLIIYLTYLVNGSRTNGSGATARCSRGSALNTPDGSSDHSEIQTDSEKEITSGILNFPFEISGLTIKQFSYQFFFTKYTNEYLLTQASNDVVWN
jgi:hypothetical protein